MSIALAVAFAATLIFLAGLWQRLAALRRLQYIRTFDLPQGLFARLRAKRPELTLKDCQLIARGLRQFFLAHAQSGRKFVAMPSQAVDDLWHEFILYTRHYQDFCRKAFGGFFHHTPAVVLGDDRQINAGLRRCWWYACREENINPRLATRLPLLFAIDAKLKVADGFRYVAECDSIKRESRNGTSTITYCGGDFGNSSVDGSLDGFGDASNASGFESGGGESGGGGASGSDGGGDGGSGCGGGGCGGS